MTISNQLQIGSSETTREILYTELCFENYIRFGTPQHKPNPNPIFLEWFIGFFEAEGCFLKWPDQKQKNRFGFEITQKDVQLMCKIRTLLGFGKVTEIVKKNNELYWRYSVYDLKNLMRLILLFNGNLITVKKQKEFQIWVAELYKRYSTKKMISLPDIPHAKQLTYPDDMSATSPKVKKSLTNLQQTFGLSTQQKRSFCPVQISQLEGDVKKVKTASLTSPGDMSDVMQRFLNGEILFSKRKPEICFKNAWLSGFFEGDAGFWVKSKDIVRVNKDNSQSYNIQMKFYITQKDEKELLNQIKHLFQIPSDIYQITNGSSTEKYNRLETSLLKSHLLCVQYLTKYPFLGKRQILFNRWKRVLGYRTNDYPITKKSIIKLERLIYNTK